MRERVCVLVRVLRVSPGTVSLYSCTRTGAICPRPQNAKCLRQTVRDRIREAEIYARIYRSVIYPECRSVRLYHPSLYYSSDERYELRDQLIIANDGERAPHIRILWYKNRANKFVIKYVNVTLRRLYKNIRKYRCKSTVGTN